MASYHVQKAKEAYLRKKALVVEIKSAPCADCKGVFHHSAMDFDHVKGEKVKDVSWLLKNTSWQTVLNEIEKCEVVCANCHRVRTYNRINC